MSRFTAFIEFAQREIDGTIWEDASYRAYDLDRHTGERSRRMALRYLGYDDILDLTGDLITVGWRGDIQGPLVRWWVWHRLTTGQIPKWPLRTKRENDFKAPPPRFKGV